MCLRGDLTVSSEMPTFSPPDVSGFSRQIPAGLVLQILSASLRKRTKVRSESACLLLRIVSVPQGQIGPLKDKSGEGIAHLLELKYKNKGCRRRRLCLRVRGWGAAESLMQCVIVAATDSHQPRSRSSVDWPPRENRPQRLLTPSGLRPRVSASDVVSSRSGWRGDLVLTRQIRDSGLFKRRA